MRRRIARAIFPIILISILCGNIYQNRSMQANDYEMRGTIITAYTGTDTETTTPEAAAEIGEDAFSWDMGHGEQLKTVIVTGNIKKIDDRAFAFTAAKKIVIEEGVEEIGDRAFMDSYIGEIYFPATIQKVGSGIMETEEGLRGTKIYVEEGSVMEKYFKAHMPYGECSIRYLID